MSPPTRHNNQVPEANLPYVTLHNQTSSAILTCMLCYSYCFLPTHINVHRSRQQGKKMATEPIITPKNSMSKGTAVLIVRFLSPMTSQISCFLHETNQKTLPRLPAMTMPFALPSAAASLSPHVSHPVNVRVVPLAVSVLCTPRNDMMISLCKIKIWVRKESEREHAHWHMNQRYSYGNLGKSSMQQPEYSPPHRRGTAVRVCSSEILSYVK